MIWICDGAVKTVNSILYRAVMDKERREQRSLSIRTITEESGASRSTVERLLNNSIRRVPLDDLGALCRYFDCAVSDILEVAEDDNEEFAEEMGPALVRHAPYLGFQLYELVGCRVWMRCEVFVAAKQARNGKETLISYWLDHARTQLASVAVRCSVQNARDTARQMRQAVEQRKRPYTARSLDIPLGTVEARTWFSDNQSAAFAANRFTSRDIAIDFVQSLYDAGAIYVAVEELYTDQFGPYADTFWVMASPDIATCLPLWAILNEDAQHGGCVIRADRLPHRFSLWWD